MNLQLQTYHFGQPEILRGDYRYTYNGMESDKEVSGDGNSFTTQFRQYDPRLGRWKSLDPLAGKYPGQSPFAAFNNNPIFYIDPLGLEGTNPGEVAKNAGKKVKWNSKSDGKHSDKIDGVHANGDLDAVEVNSSGQCNQGGEKSKPKSQTKSKRSGNKFADVGLVQSGLSTSGDVLDVLGGNQIAKGALDNGKFLKLGGGALSVMSGVISIYKIKEGTPQEQSEGVIELGLTVASAVGGTLAALPGAVYTVASYDKEATKQLNKNMQKAYAYNKTALDKQTDDRIKHMYSSSINEEYHNCECYDWYPTFADWHNGTESRRAIFNAFGRAYDEVVVNGDLSNVKEYYDTGYFSDAFMDKYNLWMAYYGVDGVTGAGR